MHLLLTLAWTLLQIVLVAAFADFLAGVVHWIEDAYFTENTPIIGPLFIRPNILHHHQPRYFTRLSWWDSSKDLLGVGVLLLVAAYPFGLLTWQLGLFVVISVNANQVHKWSHRTRAENGWLISKLQDWRVLQTPRHHGVHHSDPKNTFYCPVTNLVNPLLERLDFWTRVEGVIEKVTGVAHRPDTAVRGQGPGPEWLAEYRPKSAAHSAPAVPLHSRRNSPAAKASAYQRTCSISCSSCTGHCPRRTAKFPAHATSSS